MRERKLDTEEVVSFLFIVLFIHLSLKKKNVHTIEPTLITGFELDSSGSQL